MAEDRIDQNTHGSVRSPWIRRVFPFLSWIGELRDRVVLRADIVAGITVAAILIPQSMANAQLASLPLHYGLYAALLPPVVSALFGSSRQLSTGAVAVLALMTTAALQPLAALGSDAYIAYAILLALMVGLIQMALGLLRLGALVNFLSQPVVIGFTNAAALIIGTSQIYCVFGTPAPSARHQYEQVWEMAVAAVSGAHGPTMLAAAVAFGILISLRRTRIPGVLIATLATGLLSWLLDYETLLGGAVVGTIPIGLPDFRVPQVSISAVGDLFLPACAISLIGFMSTISIGKAVAARTRQRLDANQELIGQGLSNIVGSLFQSHPVCGSFARSAVNFRAGARTGFSSVVAGSVAMITLLWLTPLLYYVPLATLAAIIMMSVFGLIQIRPILRAWKAYRQDSVVAVSTFLLTLAFAPELEIGILLGVGLSLLVYLYRTMRPRVAELSRHPDGTFRDADVHRLKTCKLITVIRFDGGLYFGSSGFFEDKVMEKAALRPDLKYVVVDAEGINHVDATGEEVLMRVFERLHEAGIEVLFAQAKKQIADALERTGSLGEIGEARFFRTLEQAIAHAWRNLEEDHAVDCPLRKAQLKDVVQNYSV